MLIPAMLEALEAILRVFRPQILQVMRTVPAENAGEAQELFGQALWELTLEARRQAFSVGAQFAIEQAIVSGYRPPDPANPGYSPESVNTVIRENWRGNAPWDSVADRLESHVRTASRQAVITAVEEITEDLDNLSSSADELDEQWSDLDAELDAAPEYPAWARVLTGNENCAFCIMLASRGPVYSSAAAGGQMSAAAKWADATGWINSYHDHCDCAVVMVANRSTWEGWEQVRAAEALYDKAVQKVADDDLALTILQAIDQILADAESNDDPVHIPAIAA